MKGVKICLYESPVRAKQPGLPVLAPADALAVLDLVLPQGDAVSQSCQERGREKGEVTAAIRSHGMGPSDLY